MHAKYSIIVADVTDYATLSEIVSPQAPLSISLLVCTI
jgi:hypothetical protein